MHKLIIVTDNEGYAAASLLFKEYAAWLNIDLSFQNFDEELSDLQKMYGQPSGCIILAKNEDQFIGCIAVRKRDTETAEIKRMYVKQDLQQKGIGSSLLHAAMNFAKNAGYKKIQLDTLNDMLPAIGLYKKHGFYEIPAYYFNPQPTAVYFEKTL